MSSSPLSSLSPSPSPPFPPSPFTYRYTPTEAQVFSAAPPLASYKTALLPLWRFRTPSLAHTSAAAIYARFLAYDAADDFVGMDMCRKYLQMGMTRAKRYANYKGGRKYGGGEGEGERDVKEGAGLENATIGTRRATVGKSDGHADKAEKEEASRIFREVWERAKAHEGYVARKDAFLAEQRKGDGEKKRKKIETEAGEDSSVKTRRKRTTVKVETG
ncbi:hypothetical protein MMC18_008275 [Xylographa bjoerkii]|nr:hypothetical protein [Xylographa bjoerkii]